ncbi:MAG: CorA family divalent cation transporter [Candidatus Bilamarchaeaceae archaeon]
MPAIKRQKKAKNAPVHNSNEPVILALEERGFCVAQMNDASIARKESRKVEDFFDMLGKSSISWFDYVLDDFVSEAPAVMKKLGFSDNLTKSLLKDSSNSGYEDFGNEMGILLPAVTIKEYDVNINPLLILLKGNSIFTIHTTEVKRFFRLRRYAETLIKKLPAGMETRDKMTLLLIRVIDQNNSVNFDHLREIEEQGDKLSEELADPKTPRAALGYKIHQMKHMLIVYLGGLWETIDALNSIRYGDADLLTDDEKILDRITGLIVEVQSHIGLAEHLSEVLASGLEVVQSIYNNQLQILNNRLALMVAYLTIIGTALLVPNTIATVAGNMMFNFGPQDVGWYISLIVVSTIIGTIFAWWLVKKLGLLPSKPDESD